MWTFEVLVNIFQVLMSYSESCNLKASYSLRNLWDFYFSYFFVLKCLTHWFVRSFRQSPQVRRYRPSGNPPVHHSAPSTRTKPVLYRSLLPGPPYVHGPTVVSVFCPTSRTSTLLTRSTFFLQISYWDSESLIHRSHDSNWFCLLCHLNFICLSFPFLFKDVLCLSCPYYYGYRTGNLIPQFFL